jgi:tetratricopeptide (TPR) repeat protein
MKDRDSDSQKPGPEEIQQGGAEPGTWDPTDPSAQYDDVVPLHTGEVEILDEEFLEDSFDVQGGGAHVEEEGETNALPVEEMDDGQAPVEDDPLFSEEQLAFDEGAPNDGEPVVYEEEVVDDDAIYAEEVDGAFDALAGDLGEEAPVQDSAEPEPVEEYAEGDYDEEHSLDFGEGDYDEEVSEELVDVGFEEEIYEEPGQETWRTRQSLFKEESQQMALGRKWTELAELSRQALNESSWARKGANRVTLLLDLGRLYRDRLGEPASAEEVFALLADEDPTHSEALTFLAEQYRQTSNWDRLYQLYVDAVAPTWDPNERLERTREAADIALNKLDQPERAIDAWEQLWNLKDAREEAERELLYLYRSRALWERLADFLIAKTEGLEEGQQRLSLREVAEVYLSGVGDRPRALEMLQQILERRPGDPVTLLTMAAVYSKEAQWEALSGLSDQRLEGVSADVNLEFVRLIADAFWKAGEYDSAYELYRKVLAEDPDDSRAIKAVEEYLSQTDRHDELLEFLESRAARAKEEDQQLELLSRMALIAQTNLGSPSKASELWERCVALRPDTAEYHEALASLYDSLADLEGVARALEGQLVTRRDPTGRIELLRMLGEHYSDRMQDDDQAERCWNEVLALSPEDYGARQQLLSISRRRGDFEGLNTALEREMALTRDADWRLELARQSAQNLDDNFDDKARSIAAWQRVLDLAPTDTGALSALEKHHQTAGAKAEMVFTLSRQIDAATEVADRRALVHHMAALREEDGKPRAAAAAEEWALRLDARDADALEKLGKHYRDADQTDKYLGALEHGSTSTDDMEARAALFAEAAERASQEERAGRFFWLRRILGLKGGSLEVLQPLRDTADAAKQWPALAEIYGRLTVTADSEEARRDFRREHARILESEVDDKGRAFLELQSLMLNADADPSIVEELGRLAGETGRSEDHYAVLGAVALSIEDVPERRATLAKRAELCDKGLESPARAFEEYRALLDLEPGDEATLAELVRLAESSGLYQQLDEVYAELFDRSEAEVRLELCAKRVQLHRDKLEDARGAFDLQLLMFRLAPQTAGLEDELCAAAAELGQWEHLQPILEAHARSGDPTERGVRLLRLAKRYEEHLDDADYAFELAGEALVAAPESDDVLGELKRLAESGGAWQRLTACLRAAAACCTDDARRIALYELAAEVYQGHEEQGEQASVMYRHIQSLRPDNRPALEALIAWHRGREEWDQLRDLLVKRIDTLGEEEDRVGAWLEVAQISEQELKQPEQALLAYTEVLALDADNSAALEGFSSLESSFTEPTQHVRKMRAELHRAEPERAAEIRLAMARLLEDELEDLAGAKEALHEQVSIDGPVGPAYDRLLQLYESSEDWSALSDLLEVRAGALEDPADQLAMLQRAIDIRHEHLADQEHDRLESLYRGLLKLRPDDELVLSRLVEQLRAASRWEDMAELLEQVSERMERPDDRARVKRDLARVLHLGLGKTAEAEAVYRTLIKKGQEDESAACALASFAAAQESWGEYIKMRETQAKLLPPRLAGLVYCHLAETADEKEEPVAKVSLFYRKARSLDPDNQVAMDGLRAIGRRLKNWREQSALLPEPDERSLSFAERAQRLMALGDGVIAEDVTKALDWYCRAVAVSGDDPNVWAGVAKAASSFGDRELAEAATQRRLLAFERSVPPTTERLADHVALITESAEQLMEAGEVERARPLLRHAHELMPSFVPAALSVAEENLDNQDAEGALIVANNLLEKTGEDLGQADRIRALLCSSKAALALERPEDAQESLRQVLALEPLHGQALKSLAEQLVASGKPIEAIQYFLRVLLVVDDETERGQVYREMGLLWEDAIANLDEAAAAYERAMAAGLDDPELLRRTLKHLVRHAKREQALAVVDALLPVTEDPQEMAELWVAQGQIFLLQEDDYDRAVEAFDMALSYVPGYAAALMGLADVLEKREDWAQLLEILDASLELQPPEEQAASLRRMAMLYQERLADFDRAEEYLRRSVDMEPTKEALETLQQIYEADAARYADRYPAVLAGLVNFGPPYFGLVSRMGEMAFSQGNERWGWALQAPLANVRSASADVKTQLRALRKQYDKAPLPVLSEDDYIQVVRHRRDLPALTEALVAADAAIGPLGMTDQNEANAKAAYKLSPNAGLGKTCHLVTEALGLPGRMTFRADGIGQNWLTVNGEVPEVLYLTEFLRQFVRAESSFLFGYTLEWTRPGHVVIAACDEWTREALVGGILQVTELIGDQGGAIAEMAGRLGEAADVDTVHEWATTLEHLRNAKPKEVLSRYMEGIQATARRVGLLMAGDVLSGMRAWGRLTGAYDNPQAKQIEELDELVTANPELADLLSFASSEPFGRILSGS